MLISEPENLLQMYSVKKKGKKYRLCDIGDNHLEQVKSYKYLGPTPSGVIPLKRR